jgi:hypothetical protein
VLLPNVAHALIDIRKLSDYCLNPAHPVGRHKALVFQSALGFSVTDADTLGRLILQAIHLHEASAGRLDEFGQRYTVDFAVSTSVGFAVLRTAWMVRADEDFPRLTTCFVLPD